MYTTTEMLLVTYGLNETYTSILFHAEILYTTAVSEELCIVPYERHLYQVFVDCIRIETGYYRNY